MNPAIFLFQGTSSVSHSQLFAFYATFDEGSQIVKEIDAIRQNNGQARLSWTWNVITLATFNKFFD